MFGNYFFHFCKLNASFRLLSIDRKYASFLDMISEFFALNKFFTDAKILS